MFFMLFLMPGLFKIPFVDLTRGSDSEFPGGIATKRFCFPPHWVIACVLGQVLDLKVRPHSTSRLLKKSLAVEQRS